MSTPATVPDFIPSESDAPDFIPLTPQTLQAHVASQAAPVHQGFLGSLGSDLYGMAKGAVNNLSMSTAQRLDNLGATRTNDASRQAAGNSLLYRAPAALAERLGVNVSGMEQAGTAGDVGGVLGHAAAMPTAMALTAGAAKATGALGKIPGIRTRATNAFSGVESKIGEAPIDHQPVLNTAYKAMEMGAKGFQLPKPVSDFVEWAKAVQASRTPFKFADARDFYTSLGETIPWEQYGGKGGRMYNQVMKMRSQLGDALKTTASDNGLGEQYTKALQDYRSSARIVKGAKNVGSVATLGLLGKSMGLSGGDLMALLTRKVVNAGAMAPESAAGSLVKSVAPEYQGMSSLDMENVGRNGNPSEQQQIQDLMQRAAESRRGMGSAGVNPDAPAQQIMQTVRQQRPDLFTGRAAPMNAPPSSGTPEGAAFETNTFSQVQAEHPTWDIGKQLQEAAIRAKRAR